MSVKISQTASFVINGVTTLGGVGFTLLASPSLLTSNVDQGDYFAETFTINPSTTSVRQLTGSIVTGKVLWIQTDSPITITLNQGTLLTPVNHTFTVDSFLFMNATFVEIYLTNDDPAVAANINLICTGDRVLNPGTPGIW